MLYLAIGILGATVMPQTQIYAKNNDDCSMNQDKSSTWVVSKNATSTKIVAWRGCNGNGNDDGWVQAATLTKDGAGTKQIFTPLDNDGQLTVSAGQLNLNGGDGGADAGTFTTADGLLSNEIEALMRRNSGSCSSANRDMGSPV